MRRFTNNYNPDGKEKRRQSSSRSVAVRPIELDMANATEAHQIIQGVRLSVSRHAKISECNDVGHGKLFSNIIPASAATRTEISITSAGRSALGFPIWTVPSPSTFPMRTLLTPETHGQPRDFARLRAKRTRRLYSVWVDFKRGPALFALELDALSRKMRVAFSRTIASWFLSGGGFVYPKFLPACFSNAFYLAAHSR